MKTRAPVRIRTISEFHRLRNLPAPMHPLISIVDYSLIRHDPCHDPESWTLDFYSVSLKKTTNSKIRYGQQQYDFDNGVLFFMAPGQVFSIAGSNHIAPQHTGWIMLIHPDFLWNTPLAKSITRYEFFDYAVNEALFLSAKEQKILRNSIRLIEQEYQGNIDEYSQAIILSHIETLLSYSERFYRRQFITRKITNNQVVARLGELLSSYFDNDQAVNNGLPTVQYIAEALHLSPNYLSSLLKIVTGRSTQHHIHEKLIEKAKEKLSTTRLTVNEIAFELGFGRSQSFSKLFKSKTNLSPLEFRRSFSNRD